MKLGNRLTWGVKETRYGLQPDLIGLKVLEPTLRERLWQRIKSGWVLDFPSDGGNNPWN